MAVLRFHTVMSRPADAEKEGIVGLLRQTVEGLGDLVADHVKLARVELEVDARQYGAGVAVLLIAVLVVTIGYVFAWIAAAIALARLWGAPAAFGAIAALHLVVGVIAVVWARGRMKRTTIMQGTASEVRSSVDALARPLQGRLS